MTDKKWLFASVLVLAVFAYFMLSFVRETDRIRGVTKALRGDPDLTVQERHVVLIEQEQGHPYWQLVEEGAVAAAKANGIAIECIGPVRNNMEEQLKLLEKAIAARVDGIIVQGLNQARFGPVIDKAVSRGIPVVTVDTDAPDSERLAFVGTDNREAGRRQGELVVQATGGVGAIGIIIGSDQAESQLQRLEGIKSAIVGYPGLRIVDVRSSNISQMEAIQQASEMLQSHPDITLMVGTSATDALGILQAAKSLKRKDLPIIGFDDLPETITAIQNGEIEATVVQQPYRMGELSVVMLKRHFEGERLERQVYTPTDVLERVRGTGGSEEGGRTSAAGGTGREHS